ncbi:helix-turn-helix domain-containing protein [Rummeliibacillus sp. POC4]|uniref:helix-turn-helix domain-containing protein n=1 Tax=Rummeliibacillus sp. POC4 TaxID=2305899 RepID=UPI000E65F8FA|nr:helix-turn-helix domain-containing protein [Rummeliibacillus sp. POC4]RIJ63125.1 DNA-binding protein [Rummeliibacillus sp. POC4]
MFQVQIDEQHVDEVLRNEIQKRLNEVQVKYTYWDMKDLCEQVKLCETTIKETFFYDKRFPKFKVGRKWLFPAEEAKQFLLQWAKEQPSH